MVVVGGGPVGYCTALGLASHGVPVVLIEADDSVCFGSRAICISRRSLEIVERLGALDGFLEIGLPWTGGRSFYRDTEVLHFTMPQDENQKLPPMVNLAQYSIEQILLDAARDAARPDRHPLADPGHRDRAARRRRAARRSPRREGDYALARRLGGRRRRRAQLPARGARPASSKGTSYEGRYVIVDILLDSERPTERLAYFDPPCNPGSTVLVHKQPNNVWRIDYQLRDGEDPDAAIKPENVMPRVASLLEMMGERGAWKPIWIGHLQGQRADARRAIATAACCSPATPRTWCRSSACAAPTRASTTPTTWPGSWRSSSRGWRPSGLLDSYSDERVAAAHENLSYGTKSTEFMAPPSFAFDLMRTAVLGLAVKHPALRSLINPRQTSAITYADVAAQRGAGTHRPRSPPARCRAPCCPNARSPSSTASGTREGHLTDLLGPHFTRAALLRRRRRAGRAARPRARAGREARAVQGGLADPRASATHRRRTAGTTPAACSRCTAPCPARSYLVRPDGHVLGRWRQADAAEALAAIDRALHP